METVETISSVTGFSAIYDGHIAYCRNHVMRNISMPMQTHCRHGTSAKFQRSLVAEIGTCGYN